MADDNIVSIRIMGAVDASLTASAAAAQSAIANIGSAADRAQSPLQNLGDATARLGTQMIAAVRDSGQQIVQADQGTVDQRKQAVAALWDSFIEGENLTAQQMTAIDKERTAQLAEIDKQAAANKRAIDQENLSTSIELAKIELSEKKALLDQEVADGQITNAQKIQLLKDYETIASAIEIQLLQKAIDSGNLTVVAANADANKIAVIREQLKATLQQIDTGAAETSAQIWQSANQEILSSEGMLVSDMVTKRQKLARDLEQVGWQLIEKELSQDAEYWTEAALLAVEGTGKIKATQQGGLLQNAAMSMFGGGNGAAGGAANSLTQTPQLSALTANTTALSSLTAALTSHGVLVTTNSGALSLGAAATTTNATTTGAHAAVMGANVATTSANVAATTINASSTAVSAAATTAHATVMGANTIATIANTIATWVESAADMMPFASGADNIPYDMPAFIHKGEMIVPADVASQVRAGNINIGNLADIAADRELTPVDAAGPAAFAFGGSSSVARSYDGGGNTGNFARGGDTYNNMGGLHIHGMDLATIAHNPAFQREATRVMRNMHRNAVRR